MAHRSSTLAGHVGTKEKMRGYYEQHYTSKFGRLGKMNVFLKKYNLCRRLKEEIENSNGSKSIEDIDPEGNHKPLWLLVECP